MILMDTEGKEYRISTDITDQFEKSGHQIKIETPIDVPQPQGGGGISPTVEQWEEIKNDVPIG